jgi:hypothetical protein
LRKQQGQDAAHRQTAGDDDVAMLTQPVVAFLDARVPFRPWSSDAALRAFRNVRRAGRRTRCASARQRLRNEAQLRRRPAEAMDQQHAKTATGEEQAAIWKQVFFPDVHLFTRSKCKSPAS